MYLGTGLPSLSRKLVDKIIANEYVDFAELPPAKGKAKHMPHSVDGQVVVVQAVDLFQQRRLIPEFATWAQCFAVYTAVLATKEPLRVPDLMGYMAIIARVSLKCKWPSWIVYDQNFRQEAAEHQIKTWAWVDPSIYAQCFTNMAVSAEGWCKHCQSIEHASEACPIRPQGARKRPWQPTPGSVAQFNPPAKKASAGSTVCIKYNKYAGDCKYGAKCRYQHICDKCGGAHPRCATGPPGKPGSTEANQ